MTIYKEYLLKRYKDDHIAMSGVRVVYACRELCGGRRQLVMRMIDASLLRKLINIDTDTTRTKVVRLSSRHTALDCQHKTEIGCVISG